MSMWKIIGGLIILALGASFVYAQYAAKQANEGVTTVEHVKGNPDAEVVLVEYSDFECPACAQFYPYVKDIVEEYGDQLRFEYRHFPLINIHPNAVAAARASEAAGQQGEFFAMHDKLFEGQSEWAKSAAPTRVFEGYAEEIGLDMDLFARHMNATVLEDKVMAQFDEAREMGFTGTPTFTLNGEVMEFGTFDEFREQIAATLGVVPETDESRANEDEERAVNFEGTVELTP